MTDVDVRVSRKMRSSAQDLWAILQDLNRIPEWLAFASEVQGVSAPLAVKGAYAGAADLGVEVTNQLGQRVYTGSAQDNFASQLNLSTLAPGIYHLTIRNGNEYATTKLTISL